MSWWDSLLGAEVEATLVALALIIAVRVMPRIPPAWRVGMLTIALLKLALPFMPGPMHVPLPDMSSLAIEDAAWAPNELVIWVVYSLVSLVLLGRLLVRVTAGTTRLLHESDAPNPALAKRFDRLAARLGIHGCTLRISSHDLGPLAAGLVSRFVVVPTRLIAALTPDELDAVLLHELTHHARRDLWLRLAATLVTCVWWFNPVTWLLVRELRRTTEDAADDAAVVHLGSDVRRYSDALLRSARLSARCAAGPVAELHPLGRRLLRLGSRGAAAPTLGIPGWLFCIGVGLLALSLHTGGPPAFGDGGRIVTRNRLVVKALLPSVQIESARSNLR